MRFFQQVAVRLGFFKPKMPEKLPHIAVYSLIVLDHLVQKIISLAELRLAITEYPEESHREGFVCKNMTGFVAVFPTLELLKQGIEQQFDHNGGRSFTESQRDSMERLESWYDE